MNRYKQREQAFLLIFEELFTDETKETLCSLFEDNIEELGDYSKELFFGVSDNAQMLDGNISEFSNGWRIQRIPKVNVAILRLAIYEIMFVDDVPSSVAVNEAVELAKKYSGKEDAAFINGILGSLIRSME
ncbi:MAG: transcription antitermination factor NusB [Eubacterium sp.]|nr:transcription antitermination factor NusB [Eubacterium sp.]